MFSYHMSDACYKQYCHKKSLLKLQSDKERRENDDTMNISVSEDETLRKSTRKGAPRNGLQARVALKLDSLGCAKKKQFVAEWELTHHDIQTL